MRGVLATADGILYDGRLVGRLLEQTKRLEPEAKSDLIWDYSPIRPESRWLKGEQVFVLPSLSCFPFKHVLRWAGADFVCDCIAAIYRALCWHVCHCRRAVEEGLLNLK